VHNLLQFGAGEPATRPLPENDTAQTQNKRAHIHNSSGIRTHDSCFRAGEDSSCFRPRGQCDRQENSWHYRKSNSDPLIVQNVANHYTDYATPANGNLKLSKPTHIQEPAPSRIFSKYSIFYRHLGRDINLLLTKMLLFEYVVIWPMYSYRRMTPQLCVPVMQCVESAHKT
jgi:hypothetical protein